MGFWRTSRRTLSYKAEATERLWSVPPWTKLGKPDVITS
jgi:hypothetical protein